jgi:hypothetical protein
MQPPVLQPRGIGELLDTAFRLYRRNVVLLLGLTALTLVPLTLLRLLLLRPAPAARLVELVQNVVLLPLLVAVLTGAGAQLYRQEAITAAAAYRAGARRFLSIFGAAVLTNLSIGLPIVLLSGGLTLTLLASRPPSRLVWLLLALLLLPFVVFMSVKYAVTFPAIMVEGVGAMRGIRRSWTLTTRRLWHVAGVYIATAMLTALLIVMPVLSVAYLVTMTGGAPDAPGIAALELVLGQLGVLIALPFHYLIPVVLYYDLRVRNEGYDIEYINLGEQAGLQPGVV